MNVLRCLAPLALIALWVAAPAAAADKPYRLPFNTPPGPTTWLLEQHYGNTVEAYTYGKYWYREGQGLHFGLDLEAPCGTPVLAIADGVVEWVDNGTFGAAPHNLVIRHGSPAPGYVSVYGHLQARSPLTKGQPVRAGQFVGWVGDPDLTCRSRPHLHLEIRSGDYRTAYNPADFIAADWDALALLARPIGITFSRDLAAPRRWQDVADQPATRFNFPVANAYESVWPPPLRYELRPPTLLPFVTPPLPPDPITPRRLTAFGCCAAPFWSPDSRAVWFIDVGSDGRGAVFAAPVDGGPVSEIGSAPPRVYSPSGRHWLASVNGRMTLFAGAGGLGIPIRTAGAWPIFSPDGQKLLWQVRPGDYFPDFPGPLTEIWVATLAALDDATLIRVQSAGAAYWLTSDRVLLTEGAARTSEIGLSVYDLRTGKTDPIRALYAPRRLSIAPGGAQALILLPFQQGEGESGLYVLDLRPGGVLRRLPFIGSARWRDSRTVIYVPFKTDAPMTFRIYDVRTGEDRPLAVAGGPIRVRNDDWSVSPDGRQIVYRSALDGALYILPLQRSAVF